MSAPLTYPGVYVEEISSGVRTIMGVSTAVTAFIGYTKRGLINKAQEITSFADFERKYGGLSRDSPVSYAVQQFFMNGGQSAIVVRIAQAGTANTAEVATLNSLSVPHNLGTEIPVLKIEANEPGTWANGMVVTIDYNTAQPDSTFNLHVFDPSTGRRESFLGLTMNPDSRRRVNSVITTDTSNLITAQINSNPNPLDTLNNLNPKPRGTSISGSGINNAALAAIGPDHFQFMITLNEDDGPKQVTIPVNNIQYSTFDDLASAIGLVVTGLSSSASGSSVKAYSGFTCVYDSQHNTLILTSGEEGAGSLVRINSAVVQDAARLLQLGTSNGGKEIDAAAAIRPASNGTTSGSLDSLLEILNDSNNSNRTWVVDVTIDGDGPHPITVLNRSIDIPPTNLKDAIEWLRQLLHKSITAIKPNKVGSMDFMGINSEVIGNSIKFTSGSSNPNSVIVFDNPVSVPGSTDANDLMLSPTKSTQNVKEYSLGTGATLACQSNAIPGSDGYPPSSTDFQGSEVDKTGINALLDVDLFNILCLPGVTDFPLDEALAVLSSAVSFCEEHRAFLIIDCPDSWKTLDNALSHLSDFDSVRSKNAAMYFPRLQMPDILDENRLRTFPQCGVVAGIYARTDGNRGVWKAPAGQETLMTGVRSLDYRLTDKENGLLNPLGLNCLRVFPAIGPVVWGARTLQGADVLTSEWKYIPVRRTALFIEESLYRGLKWVVFEPNDEPLWSQIRLNVGAFMHDLFRKGAFQGQTAQEAYFVKCDKETTTQSDIDSGIVNILVGFAPLKPAEFVVIKLQQMAGQTMT